MINKCTVFFGAMNYNLVDNVMFHVISTSLGQLTLGKLSDSYKLLFRITK
jgi:hypothetical protein